MVAEDARRRSGFEGGAWIEMADGQKWLFPHPPAPGVDAQYDALVQGLLEAEDRNEARRFELSMAISLLSRNYEPLPGEYEEIFAFGANDVARSSAQEAISELIYANLDDDRYHAGHEPLSTAMPHLQLRDLPALISSCATHFRAGLAPRKASR
jgi:hypothetical protein